jgi:hypothetical protein
MKSALFGIALAILLIPVIPVTLVAQEDTIRIPIVIGDSTGSLDTLIIGFSHFATRCIDVSLGEQELPPPPPAEYFDARFISPGPADECLGQGVRLNIVPLLPFSTDTFRIRIQPLPGSTRYTLSWPPIPCVSYARLRDIHDGALIDIDMLLADSVTFTATHAESLDITIVPPLCPGVRPEPGGKPERFGLLPNFPNPFNPSTTLRFDIHEYAFVELRVFTLLGSPVKDLVAQELQPASYSITWDGTDNSGYPASGGVYYVRLTANSGRSGTQTFVATRSVLLLK